MRFGWWVGLLSLGLVACGPRVDLAPVSELAWHPAASHPLYHRVRPGETLYAVAFRYDLDYRQLAAYNGLPHTYAIKAGQLLRIAPVTTRHLRHVAPQVAHHPMRGRGVAASREQSTTGFVWPAKGRLMRHFVPQVGQKGIDILGVSGERVVAAAPGVVAYSGSGLQGFGNLIIIKHQNQYLTAYGYLNRSFVKEGQSVRAGQVVGGMGRIDRKFWGVHFEIRYAGKPVNPLIYLKNR